MSLPQAFIEKYKKLLKEDYHDFLVSFDQPPVAGFRSNPLKEGQMSFEHPIADTNWGYYGKVSGKSIEHVTGLVYSQEPAAQMVGQVAHPKPGMKVLDLAAAPGGKTTHLLSYLNNTGLLVSNEINAKRSHVLAENVERFGARNVIVTNESTERLAKVFPSFFDLIVFDGPCSGEGMFRKDPKAIPYWHEDYPKELASLQKTILSDALAMLAPGGQLVYSTCTWSPEENEEVATWLLEHKELALVPIQASHGMTNSHLLPGTVRMYPHLFKGEGQFIAKFKDLREPVKTAKISLKKVPKKTSLTKEQDNLWQAFCQKHLAVTLQGQYQTFGDHLYLLPEGLPDLSGLRITRNGLHLGTFKKKRFEPSFALGMALKPSEVIQYIEMDIEQFERYVAGHQISLKTTYPNGWYQVVIKGNGLGFAKVVGDQLKNAYPKGLRFYS